MRVKGKWRKYAVGFKTVYVGNAKIINFPKAGRTSCPYYNVKLS